MQLAKRFLLHTLRDGRRDRVPARCPSLSESVGRRPVSESVVWSMAAGEAAEISAPHVVVVFDLLTEQTSVLGPLADPVSAMVFAEQYVRYVGSIADDLVMRVVAIEPAT